MKLPLEQLAAAQAVQVFPPLPQAEAAVPATQVLLLQHPLQLVVSQVHVLLTQCCPVLQVTAQPPQFVLVFRLTQLPLQHP